MKYVKTVPPWPCVTHCVIQLSVAILFAVEIIQINYAHKNSCYLI